MFAKKNKNLIFICLLVFQIINPFNFIEKTKALERDSGSVPGELLIKLKGNSKIYKVKITDNLMERQRVVLDMPEVEWAEPNYLFKMSYLPNDLYYHEQWYFNKIKTPQAWDLIKGGDGDIIIAVLDTGVDIDHPDIKKNVWINQNEVSNDGKDNDNNGYIDDLNGWDFIRNNPNPRPKFDELYTEGGIHHGTLVAGIAAASGDNNEGVLGIAWQSKIMPLRVLNSEGVGSVDHVIQAINYAVNNGANVINLSFVGTSKSYFLAEALKSAWHKGLIIVAAAGNETTDQPVNLNQSPNYPICLDEKDENFIIGVAAVDNTDRKALFSDYGSNCVDISAPGTRIYGLLSYNQNYDGFKEYYGGYWSGTSLAAPMVSGLAALVWSVNPLFSNKQVQNFILSKADGINLINPNYKNQLGTGRINAYQAVEYAYNQLSGLPQSHYIVTGAGASGGPHIRAFDSSGLLISNFFAFHESFRGGVNVAAGDVDGDGRDEIIAGAGASGGPHIRVFDLYGQPKGGFFAFHESFRGGVNVAAGDVDGDGRDEIITGIGKGGLPQVKIFDLTGNLKKEIMAFHESFRGGVNVAAGDVDGDGRDEIIAGAGASGGPHIRVFDKDGNLKFHFFAFHESFRGGVNVAAGDVDGDMRDEIIVSVASGASSYVRIFSPELLLLRYQFLAHSKDFYNGVRIATADFDNNQQAEIITSSGPIIEPQVQVFDSLGGQLSQFYAYNRYFRGGVNVATIRTQGY
ncbi:MAG: S8 family serine peptidase [Patescibacteria group bacterium]|jgi:subtilisin family serine protease|nr:S8 family serine peptidase [Patescibacteria group bacterium]MDD5172789.1 S8 family serine peptidase [Patescibacteria group bacterium]